MNRRVLALAVAAGLLLGGTGGYGDVEDLARLHFAWAEEASSWFEGFAEAVDGQEITYHSHRDQSAQARIVRALDGEDFIEWRSAPIPAEWTGESATFVWVAGLGCNLGHKSFDLQVNGEPRFTFRTTYDRTWTVEGTGGGQLQFVAVQSDRSKDLFGYMKMTVPAAWLTPGEALLLKVIGEAAGSKAWVMTYEYPDALAAMHKPLYHELSFLHFGAARVRVACAPEWAGRSIALRSGRQVVGEAVLAADEGGAVGSGAAAKQTQGISVATITIPRDEQAGLRARLPVLVSGRRVEVIKVPDFAEIRLRAFLSEELGFSGYVFSPGDFPRPQWQRPAMVFNEMGEFDLEVSFCDADMNPVETAEEPGRYGAVVEAVTPDGYQMQRYFTLFCCAEGWDWEARFGVEPEPFAPLGIPADVWQVHEDEIRDYLGWSIPERLNEKADGAVFWAGMSELAPTISPEVPEANVWYRDRQWWADFKRKQFGADEKYPALARPAKLATPRGNALREGDPASVGYSEESLDEIRKVCDEWAEVAEEPLAVLLAHKGVIVLHEAFGTKNDGQPMTLDTPRWMASITKLMTGCLMMQFVDQGLVGLDDPVSKYLPEFDRPVRRPMTIRHLFTHTAGLHRAPGWGGDWSASFENTLGHYLPHLEVAQDQAYTGSGYAVAGKVMERVGGLAIPYLHQRLLLGPLAMTHTEVAGTAGDCASVPLDMARVGQMLLNRGSYEQWQFFSEQTFEKMLPVPISRLLPGRTEGVWGARSWGTGVTHYSGHGLGDKTIGHGAASGAILRVDPEHELVIVCCRNSKGADYEEYAHAFVEACTAPFSPGDAPTEE